MPAIGYVTRQEDGSFKGQLRTLSIRADIEIVPNRTKTTESQPDYRIVRPVEDGGSGPIMQDHFSKALALSITDDIAGLP